MKRRFIACAAALGLVWATAAMVHGDERHKAHDNAAQGRGDGHAAALGVPGDPGKVTRTIEVEMGDDMRFRPDSIRVKEGETVRFIVRNTGKLKHEMVLGTVAGLKEHAELMRKFPGMEHADPNQASVEPGGTGELVWRFTRNGTVPFACLQPGHFEAGMAGRVTVDR